MGHGDCSTRLFGRKTQNAGGGTSSSLLALTWMFPKIGVPPKIIHFYSVFHYQPSILAILGYPYFLETSISQSNPEQTDRH